MMYLIILWLSFAICDQVLICEGHQGRKAEVKGTTVKNHILRVTG